MKLKLTSKQMLMLLDKLGVPKGEILKTTGKKLDKILSEKSIDINNKLVSIFGYAEF